MIYNIRHNSRHISMYYLSVNIRGKSRYEVDIKITWTPVVISIFASQYTDCGIHIIQRAKHPGRYTGEHIQANYRTLAECVHLVTDILMHVQTDRVKITACVALVQTIFISSYEKMITGAHHGHRFGRLDLRTYLAVVSFWMWAKRRVLSMTVDLLPIPPRAVLLKETWKTPLKTSIQTQARKITQEEHQSRIKTKPVNKD